MLYGRAFTACNGYAVCLGKGIGGYRSPALIFLEYNGVFWNTLPLACRYPEHTMLTIGSHHLIESRGHTRRRISFYNALACRYGLRLCLQIRVFNGWEDISLCCSLQLRISTGNATVVIREGNKIYTALL